MNDKTRRDVETKLRGIGVHSAQIEAVLGSGVVPISAEKAGLLLDVARAENEMAAEDHLLSSMPTLNRTVPTVADAAEPGLDLDARFARLTQSTAVGTH